MARRTLSNLDKLIGLDWYITDTDGIGGRLREHLEDFVVEEVLVDGTVVHTSLTSIGEHSIRTRPGSWTWIVIEKRDIDTISVVIMLVKALGVRFEDVQYAGLKDARAVAAQIISVRNASPEEVCKLNLGDRIRVLDVRSSDRPFTTSEIWGNRFVITIRNVKSLQEESLSECIKQIAERGLPNYYGYQRFGVRRPNSHVIGKHIVMRRFEEAIREMIVSSVDLSARSEVMELMERDDYERILSLIPRSVRYYPERTVVRRLIKNKRDYVGALRGLPRDLLRLYVESYQSYMFNKVLSLRIERGLPINRAVPDDIVVLLDERGLPTGHVMRVTESLVDKVNSMICQGRASVVIPLVSYDMRVRCGVMQELIQKVMREEGVSSDQFRLRELPELNIRSSFRQISVNPLIEEVNVVDGSSLRLTFRLPRGSYATVFLREIMKPLDPQEAGF